jgi:RES domain-containing protein
VTLSAWRITKRKHVRTAFSGKGASDFGGRWNGPGTPIVYVAGSQALAALEMLAHLDSAEVLLKYVMIEVRFDESLVTEIGAELPRDWATDPPPVALAAIGDQWAASGRSAVLRVPSALVPSENNYLLSTRHPDFPRIEIGKPIPYRFDPRLAK